MHLEVISRHPEVPSERPPLLFVHGAWHGAWCWNEHFLGHFAAAGWECHAVSLRGHGGSEGRERLRWTRVGRYVDDVAQVAAGLRRPPIVIGHSMGGFVAQRFAGQHPTAGIVLLASVPHYGAALTSARLARRHPTVYAKCLLSMRLRPVVDDRVTVREAFFSTDVGDADLDRWHSLLQDESFGAFVDLMGLGLPKPKRVTVPVLVVGAADDWLVTPADVRRTAAAYRTDAVVIDRIAHDVMLESRWREVAAVMERWLSSIA